MGARGSRGLPFVGRRTECDWLAERLSEALSGDARLALISGEAGMGKTRLLREFAPRFRQAAALLYGHCYQHNAPPYLPVAEAIRTCLERFPDAFAALDPAESESIDRMLGRSPAGAVAVSSEAEDPDQVRLYLAASRLLLLAAGTRPLVLVFDDLHWMDAPSLDLVSHLVYTVADRADAGGVPILICATMRPDEPGSRAASVVARWRREQVCRLLALEGLGEMEVSALIRSMDFPRPSHQLVSTLIAATNGNPLFVQEAMRYLQRRGALTDRGGSLVTTIPASDIRLPGEVTDAISGRIDDLDAVCQTALTMAALLGDAFTLDALAMVTEGNGRTVLDALELCEREGLLTSQGDAYAFTHPLIRHICYARTSGPRRRRIHREIADALETKYQDSPEQHTAEIAHHLIQAGTATESHRLVEYARFAGEQALGVFAWAEAARFFEAAVQAALGSSAFSRHDVADLSMKAGFAYYRDLDIGPCLHHLDTAIAGYRDTGDLTGLVQALALQTGSRITQSSVRYGTMVDLRPMEEALEQLGDTAPDLAAQLLTMMSQAYWTGGQIENAEATGRRALEIGEQLSDPAICTSAHDSLALVCLQNQEVGKALEHWASSLENSESSGDPWAQGWALSRIPLGLFWCGRLADAEEAAASAKAVIRRTQDWAEYSMAVTAETCVRVSRGVFAEAEQSAQEAMLALQRSRYPWAGPIVLPALASGRAAQGDWAEAEDVLDILTAPGQVFEEPGPAIVGIARMSRQLLAAHRGDPVDFEQIGRFMSRQRDSAATDAGLLASLAAGIEICDLASRPDLVGEAATPLQAAWDKGVVFTTGWVLLIPRILGVAAALNGRWDDAEACFQRAVQVTADADARLDLGRACLDYARMLQKRAGPDDVSAAADLLWRAETLLAEVGAGALLERCREAVGVAETPFPSQSAQYPDDLSAREVQVLREIARGQTNQQIADALILSPKTVARHVSNIFAKTHVENRAAATAYAFEHALIGK